MKVEGPHPPPKKQLFNFKTCFPPDFSGEDGGAFIWRVPEMKGVTKVPAIGSIFCSSILLVVQTTTINLARGAPR